MDYFFDLGKESILCPFPELSALDGFRERRDGLSGQVIGNLIEKFGYGGPSFSSGGELPSNNQHCEKVEV